MAELLPLVTTVQNNGYTCSENPHILKRLLGLGIMIMHPSIIVRKRFGSIKKKTHWPYFLSTFPVYKAWHVSLCLWLQSP